MPIRDWAVQDLPRVAALLQELSVALNENQTIDPKEISVHFKHMASHDEHYGNYVFEDNGQILGLISVVYFRSLYHKTGVALVDVLVVSSLARHRGVGSELFRHTIEIARTRGIDEVQIGVLKDNIAAIQFYKKNGVDEEYLLLGMEIEESNGSL